MNRNEAAYIQLISNCINDECRPIDLKHVETDSLVELCKLHRNVSIIYSALQKQKTAPKEMIEIFKKGFYTEMLMQSKKMTVYNTVTEALNNNRIKHIVVKGVSFAKCYPFEEYRTMGDIDFVVEEKSEQVKIIMEGLGAEFLYERSSDKVDNYRLKGIDIEIHKSIGYAGNFNRKYGLEQYYKSAIKDSILLDKYTYEFAPYYKLTYAIFHIAKHFYDSGCGVRMITDLTVIAKRYRNQIDWNRLWKDLESIGLKLFAKNLFCICNDWFDLGIDLGDYHLDNIEKVEDYILTAGVFGYNNVSKDVTQIRKQKKGSYIASIITWAFPSYKTMREHSDWFKDKPAVLLPVAYIERIIRNAKERGGLICWLKNIASGKRENDYHNNILEIMELKG